MQIKAYSGSGELVQDWPNTQSQASNAASLNELPRALEIMITVKPWGEIRRYFRLPQNVEVVKSAT
jgi:general secretion pathway protein J